MKIFLCTIVTFMFTTAANAETKREALNKIDELYEAVSQSQVEDTDYTQLVNSLNDLLSEINSGGSSFICISGRYRGEYYPYNSKAGKTIGSSMSLSTCQKSIENSKNGLLCIAGRYRGEYYPYSSKAGKTMGSNMSFNTCQEAVAKSKNTFICIAGRYSGEYYVFNTKTEKTIGSSTSFSACIGNLK